MAQYGTVMKIFDETSLLVNLGEKYGLKRGDRLVIVEKGGEVKDPETGESLGELELVKAELVAVDVQEKMSVLMTELSQAPQTSIPLSARMIQDSVKGRVSEGRRTTMVVSPGEISGQPATSPIKTGDLVRRVTE